MNATVTRRPTSDVVLRTVGLRKSFGRTVALTVTDGRHIRCQVDQAALNEVLGRLHQAGVRTLTCRPPTLEELFLRHYSAERTVAGAPR